MVLIKIGATHHTSKKHDDHDDIFTDLYKSNR